MSSGFVAVPRQLVQAKMVRRRTKILVGVMVGWVIIMTIVAGAASSASSKDAKLLKQALARPIPAPPPTYYAQAQQVAVDYLNATPTPVPVATGLPANLDRVALDATGTLTNTPAAPIPYSSIAPYSSQYLGSAKSGDQRVVDQMLVDSNGTTYVLTVVFIPTKQGPVVANLPSLAPAHLEGTPQQPLNWSTYAQANLSPGAISQITTWAQAYASNDETTLYQLTGDPNSHLYLGLGNWVVQGTPTVVSATTRGNSALVQVQVSMAEKGHPTIVVTNAYDLLMQDVNRPLPPIVAWGPAGSGWSLTPYQNAYAGAPPTASSSTTSPTTTSNG